MKRILILIKGLGRGGAEQLLLNAAPYLDRERYEYDVAYLLPWKDALVPELQAAGLSTICLDGSKGIGWVWRLSELVRRRSVDLVHAHSPYPATLARVVLRNGARVPFVYTEHGAWGRQQPVTYCGNALTFTRNDHVFAVSDHVRRTIRLPGPLSKRLPAMETLHHGLDHASAANWAGSDRLETRRELGVPAGSLVVGTVGNLRKVKGHKYLLRAAERLSAVRGDFRVVLVGRGPLTGSLREEAAALGLDAVVTFTGFRDDAQRLIDSFDVFVLPSSYEGLSIALLEAMALGKPCVVTSVGGLPEQVRDGKEGLLVPPEDPVSLANAVQRLLDDPVLRARMGDAAQRRARTFDIRNAVQRMEAVYEELIS